MSISKDHLVDVLRYRYDAYSAEAVFTQACVRAGLDGTTSFDQRALMSFREGLTKVGDRVDGVLARIDALLENASPAAPEAKAEEKGKSKGEPKADAKPEKAEKADAKVEKVDAKAEKADAKAEKTDAKAEKAEKAEKADAKAGTTITLRGVETDDDSMVLVCGAHSAVGDWEPDKAALMSRSGDTWSVTLDLPADAEVAFKFLIQDEDGEVTWEPGGNRTLHANQKLDATWRDAS